MTARLGDPLRVALGVVAVAGFAWVAAGGVARWEADLFAAANGRALALLTPVVVLVMQAGALGAVPVAAGLAWFLGRKALGRRLALAGVVAWFAAKGVKAVVGRGRPSTLLSDVVLRTGEVGGLGYPSGHVTVATALFTIAAPALPRRWRRVGWSVVAIVGFARMYVGAHLPLDLLGGIALGVAVAAGVRLLSIARARRRGIRYEDGDVPETPGSAGPHSDGGRRPRP